jgi:hypothetical protein
MTSKKKNSDLAKINIVSREEWEQEKAGFRVPLRDLVALESNGMEELHIFILCRGWNGL